MSFDPPKSRNEAILQNMLGANNVLDPPKSRVEKLYRCVQAHTSQAEWTPDMTPALWTEVALPGEIEVWKQPSGAQDAYRVGARVHFPTKDDPVYENDVDYNVYAPNVTGWHEVI